MKIALLAALLTVGVSSSAWAQSCEGLYMRRNGIYKEAGYCFNTAAAIRMFGNAGCQYDNMNDVPLSARQRRIIQEIVAEEAELGCR